MLLGQSDVACLLKACQTASTSKKPAKRGPKPKQIGPSNHCRICGWWLYVYSAWQWSRSLKATENLFIETFLKMLENESWKRSWFYRFVTENQSSRVCSLCIKKVSSTYAEFSVIKTSFQKSEHDDDSFRFKRMSTSPCSSSWFRGKVMDAMAEAQAPLIASTWSYLMLLRNGNATNTTFFSFCLSFTTANNW